jgi:hypothetical protein
MVGCVEVDMFMTLIADRWKDHDGIDNNDNGNNLYVPDGNCNRFSSLDIALSLYGLQSININHCPNVLVIIRKLTNALLHCKCSLSSKHVGISLYGLKTLSVYHNITEITQLIDVLSKNIATQPKDLLSAQSLGMSMLGLAGCASNRTDVCSLIYALTPRISELDPQSCSNVLSSIYNMKSESREIRFFLREISKHMDNFVKPMTTQELSAAYYGLQGMSSSHHEVIDVLAALNKKLAVTSSIHSFSSQEIGNILFGLQSMSTTGIVNSSKGKGGRKRKSSSSSSSSSSRNTSGDDGVDSKVLNYASTAESSLSIILSILGTAADLIDRCPGIMKPRDIANALYGM